MAKHRHLKHLPSFWALEASNKYHCLKFAKPSVNLRDVLQNQQFLSEHGYLIIRGLLETLEELRKVDATLHTLEPQTIFINP